MWYNICGGVILLIDILVCDDSAEIVEQVKKLLCAWEKVKENHAPANIIPHFVKKANRKIKNVISDYFLLFAGHRLN